MISALQQHELYLCMFQVVPELLSLYLKHPVFARRFAAMVWMKHDDGARVVAIAGSLHKSCMP